MLTAKLSFSSHVKKGSIRSLLGISFLGESKESDLMFTANIKSTDIDRTVRPCAIWYSTSHSWSVALAPMGCVWRENVPVFRSRIVYASNTAPVFSSNLSYLRRCSMYRPWVLTFPILYHSLRRKFRRCSMILVNRRIYT